jgi:hypothetical protein
MVAVVKTWTTPWQEHGDNVTPLKASDESQQTDTDTESDFSDHEADLKAVNIQDPRIANTCAGGPDYAEKVEYANYKDNGIIVMHKNSATAQKLLADFGGRMTSNIEIDFLEALKSKTPSNLGAARVADFNENLSYAMQPQRGLRHMFGSSNDRCNPKKGEQLINAFECLLHNMVDSARHEDDNCSNMEYQGSFMRTEGTTIPQPPHVDFDWCYLGEPGVKESVFLGFFPLTRQGCFLQMWRPGDASKMSGKVTGQMIFIPYGSFLLLPCDTIHGGGFRSCPSPADGREEEYGNMRFHLYIAVNGTQLPRFQNNRYTEKDNPGRELAERFKNAPAVATKEIFSSVFD